MPLRGSERAPSALLRWLRFNAVGMVGMVLQLGVLGAFSHLLAVDYLPATFLAVEAAVLHNFVWHQKWTWRERASPGWKTVLGRLLRFHISNGMVSIIGNLVLMHALVGRMGLPVLPSNLAAIAVCALANFFLSHYFVFTPQVALDSEGKPSGSH